MNYRIKNILREKKISISELAEKIEVKRESLSRIVNGASTSVETLDKISKELNVSITDLFESNSPNEITALIDHNGQLYRANSIEELEEIIQKIKAG